jgi:hypothetical protein
MDRDVSQLLARQCRWNCQACLAVLARRAARALAQGFPHENGLARCLEQQIVDHRFILISEVSDWRRQREDDVKVGQAGLTTTASCDPPSVAGIPPTVSVPELSE